MPSPFQGVGDGAWTMACCGETPWAILQKVPASFISGGYRVLGPRALLMLDGGLGSVQAGRLLAPVPLLGWIPIAPLKAHPVT